MAGPPSGDALVEFLVQLQRLLHEGRFAVTYNYAPLAIADVCVEEGDDAGGEQTITTGAVRTDVEACRS